MLPLRPSIVESSPLSWCSGSVVCRLNGVLQNMHSINLFCYQLLLHTPSQSSFYEQTPSYLSLHKLWDKQSKIRFLSAGEVKVVPINLQHFLPRLLRQHCYCALLQVHESFLHLLPFSLLWLGLNVTGYLQTHCCIWCSQVTQQLN